MYRHIIFLLGLCFFLAGRPAPAQIRPQGLPSAVSVCTTDHVPSGTFHADAAIPDPNIGFFENAAVLLEYRSVYDVHNPPDTINYSNLRIQPGHFDWDRILADLNGVILPASYSFVLLYTLQEVPGWIWSGSRTSTPAKNIGFVNAMYNGLPPWNITSGVRVPWKNLRAIPHMNGVNFLADSLPELPNYGSTLTAIHEMAHYWGVFINRKCSVGPREWQPGRDPVSWLAGGCGHWTWVWEQSGMPGILYSGPTSGKFNEFDLYFMGLMGYAEARQATYQLYEYPRTDPPVLHPVNLDSLIFGLSLEGSALYEGDGHRIPDTDSTVQNLRTLIVVVKGRDEVFTASQRRLVARLAAELPADWQTATWGRSAMSIGIDTAQMPRAPHKVLTAAPEPGAALPPGEVRLAWDRAPFAGTYELQVAMAPDFFNPVLVQNGLAATSVIAGPFEPADYYWRIRAQNSYGAGPWSDTLHFALNASAGLVVTTTADTGAGSLRQAIELANTTAGPDTIRFAIPLADPGYDAAARIWTIAPRSALPAVTDSGLVLDGWSQQAFIGTDTNLLGPEIVLNGAQAGQVLWGLGLFSPHNAVLGLCVNGFAGANALLIDGGGDNTIAGCFIGTDATGTQAVPNLLGIRLQNGAAGNRIGLATPGWGNVISGNTNTGISLAGAGEHNNFIQGNFVGVDAVGEHDLGNGEVGIEIIGPDNLIGGALPGEGNVISGNRIGMRLYAPRNTLLGNRIGTNAAGTAAIGNDWEGLGIWYTSDNTVGGLQPGEGNTICGNQSVGIDINHARENRILGNYVGTTSDGLALGNKFSGIAVTAGSQQNTIGPGNTLAYNGAAGVFVIADSTLANTITRNAITANQGFGIQLLQGGNANLPAPVLTAVALGVAAGTAVANARIEIFSDENDEGGVFEKTVMSDGDGHFMWSYTPEDTVTGPYLTATATDAGGNTSPFSRHEPITAVEQLASGPVPRTYRLAQNYPNPFNPQTTIEYEIPQKSRVLIRIYNSLGELVRKLVDEVKPAGSFVATWDGRDQTEQLLASGIYYYKLVVNSQTRNVKRMLLLK